MAKKARVQARMAWKGKKMRVGQRGVVRKYTTQVVSAAHVWGGWKLHICGAAELERFCRENRENLLLEHQ